MSSNSGGGGKKKAGGGSSSSSSRAAGMKQGNLFSFFAKKKAPTTTTASPAASATAASSAAAEPQPKPSAAKPAPPPSSPSTSLTRSPSRQTNPTGTSLPNLTALLHKVHVGCTVAVLWPDDDEYYPAKVTGKKRGSDSVYTLVYEDGECETLDLRKEKFRFVKGVKGKGKGGNNNNNKRAAAADEEAGGNAQDDADEDGGGDSNKADSGSKKRRIQEESEEEFEFDGDEMSEGTDNNNLVDNNSVSDGSEFIVDDDDDVEYDDDEDEDEDDEDALMVTDEDDDLVIGGGRGRTGKGKGKAKAKGKASSGNGGGGERLKVTRVANPYDNKQSSSQSSSSLTPPDQSNSSRSGKRAAPFITPPPGASSSSSAAAGAGAGAAAAGKSNMNAFADFAMTGLDEEEDDNDAQKQSRTRGNDSSKAKTITPATGRKVTPVPSAAGTASSGSSNSSGSFVGTGASSVNLPNPGAVFTKPPLPQDKTANPAGTHYHNHYKFLHPAHIKDSSDRPRTDPNYNPRTLKVDYNEIVRVQVDNGGSKNISPASKQWWDIKSRYYDTLLLFKTGKFYEIFHGDADVAASVLNFSYMRGCNAHVGFPEAAYGKFTDVLVRAGYKVARVEQTETPEMLKERKRTSPKGKKPSVMNREVCSVVSAGTRTFCYMDSVDCFEGETTVAGGGGGGGASGGRDAGVGPLLVIREVVTDVDGSDYVRGDKDGGDDMDDDEGVRPVCEYGIAIIDAVRGTVHLGQFADDVLRSRMVTLLTAFAPSEILIEGGQHGASATLMSLLKSTASTCPVPPRIERVNPKESFPKSTAIDAEIRRKMERPNPTVQPWDVGETLAELHRRGYYPRASRKAKAKAASDIDDDGAAPPDAKGVGRWPEVLRVCVEGGASLALSAFGAALFYLQRSLIDEEILTMGIVKAYIPPGSPAAVVAAADGDGDGAASAAAADGLQRLATQEDREEGGIVVTTDDDKNHNNGVGANAASPSSSGAAVEFASLDTDRAEAIAMEGQIDHMSLDGTTLANLEILANSHSNTAAGTLWSKINHAKSPHGSRLLRAWLLRPLFRKADIDRRADAVEELASGGPAAAMAEARAALAKTGDVQRLLSRVHSMGGASATGGGAPDGGAGHHPNERAVLYETAKYTMRMVGDFSKLLNGLRAAATIPELFDGVDVRSGLLTKLVRSTDDGGCFPSSLAEQLDWFFDNFDCPRAAKGLFEPTRGMDDDYDDACDAVERIKRELDDYKHEMCSDVLKPSHVAKGQWKYVNIKEDSKDKYLIELPASLDVPSDFFVKGKRGSGAKQVNKYRTPVVEELVQELEQVIEVVNAGKTRGMQVVFARFDSMRPLWAAAAQATAMLDALGALAETASKPGFTRPIIMDCPADGKPCVQVMQGRHPCVEITHSGGEFIPNDLSLGGDASGGDESRVLLLSGPNMGGKSTLLRQTCLVAILAQIGCFVPAEQCNMTPVDRIFTRLGASDRILLGQSTFFVELAETAAALRGASRRSLVIMDELGRGTSTFDGTAIASAAVKHLVERNMCLALFATHYHSLLEDWREEPIVRLGHMECLVEGDGEDGSTDHPSDSADDKTNDHNITFLYTLGEGSCPKSFGINVARLAALPEEVLTKAKQISANFEAEMNGSSTCNQTKISPSNAVMLRKKLEEAVGREDWDEVERLWQQVQV